MNKLLFILFIPMGTYSQNLKNVYHDFDNIKFGQLASVKVINISLDSTYTNVCKYIS